MRSRWEGWSPCFTSEDIRTWRDEGILVQISPLFTHQPWNLAQDFSCSNTMCLEDTTINMSSLMAESFTPCRNGTPLQHSCLENPMDGGAWWAAVHGVAKSRTRLSNFAFTFHIHALEKEMATHNSVLVSRILGMAEPGGLPSMGSQSWTRLK